MAEGNGSLKMLADLPSWIRASVYVGAPVVISLYLTYFITADLNRAVAAQADALRQHVTDQAVLTTYITTLIREQERANRLLVQLCLQGATDVSDRRVCLELAR
jgi:hypothetical protein